MFIKECKKNFHSIIFWVFVTVMLLGFRTQFVPELSQRMAEPVPGLESYGTMVVESPEIIMPAAVQNLVGEYLQGYYAAWPMSFYKKVYLKEAERLEMAAVIEELTGLTGEEFHSFTEDESCILPPGLSYERFRELMQEADRLIGGGSSYSDRNLISQFGQAPKRYEDALTEYRENVTGAALGEVYARLYCDYMGIFLAIMPVFAAAAFGDLDRRAKAEALIYGRKASSAKIAGIRYAALTGCLLLPLVVSFVYTVVRLNGLYPEMNIVWGKAVLLTVVWLLPELLFVTSFAMLLTELVSPLLAVFVQGIWWFWAVQSTELSGGITKWTLLIRHNELGSSSVFRSGQGVFVWNRTCYFILAAVCIAVEIMVYEKKRRGYGGWRF